MLVNDVHRDGTHVSNHDQECDSRTLFMRGSIVIVCLIDWMIDWSYDWSLIDLLINIFNYYSHMSWRLNDTRLYTTAEIIQQGGYAQTDKWMNWWMNQNDMVKHWMMCLRLLHVLYMHITVNDWMNMLNHALRHIRLQLHLKLVSCLIWDHLNNWIHETLQ